MNTLRWGERYGRPVGVGGLFLLLLLGSGCAGIGTLRAQVLDAQTQQPIAGAVVLGVWTKQEGMVFHRTVLVGVKEAETNAEGRFELERPGALGVEESVTVYKFGYVAWNNQYIFPTDENRKRTGIPDQIPLELFPPDGSHQKHIRFIHSATMSSFSARSWVRFRDAINREDRMP